MTCSCPKCAAKLEFEVAQILDGGLSTKCSGCKVRLQIFREPFVRRAYRKNSDISCAHCGTELGHCLNCQSCGTLYPDYFVAETPGALRKRTRKTSGAARTLSRISFEWRPTSAKTQGYQPMYAPKVATAAAGAQSSSVAANRRVLVRIVSIVAIVAVLAGGYAFYTHHQSKR
ncbi:MAG TPA: hypothetical protein VIU41_12945, partial [Geobacteraceae bacterium]